MQAILIVLAICGIAVVLVLYRWQLQVRRRLIEKLLDGVSPRYTINGLAQAAKCTKLRAWMFLTGQRVLGRIDSRPVAARDVVNLYDYGFNERGIGRYEYQMC
jgi:hypothetical protein